jgi:hypothetical protein
MDKVYCGECKYYSHRAFGRIEELDILSKVERCLAPDNLLDTHRAKGELTRRKPGELNQSNDCHWYSKFEEVVKCHNSVKQSFFSALWDAITWRFM